MKVLKSKEVNTNSVTYISPDFNVTSVTIEQNVLANGSGDGILDDMPGEYW